MSSPETSVTQEIESRFCAFSESGCAEMAGPELADWCDRCLALSALASADARIAEQAADAEERMAEQVAAHWFTQGGEMQFGEISGRNADELVVSILRVVRSYAAALEGERAKQIAELTADRDEWREQHERLLVMYRASEDRALAARAEHTRAVLRYTCKGFTAGENADHKHWRERAEQAEGERATLSDTVRELANRITGYQQEVEAYMARLTAILLRAEQAEATVRELRRLAKEATNGWACYAKRKIEDDDIARLHQEIDRVSLALSAPTGAQKGGE